ncbi:3-dehydroquinate synthase [Brevibacillus fulvus]|uniref:3-dehydroquinate synthase n=1 Tax=Brevibacillus fulvus TaxID=1125967 RepID=A0A938XVH0_9BACL|nr:3-dehydroquinate synthase [Brevibacillus fulvus]MBM7588716.1 3-dehydroquinate synthase [Brevibacillus fulvus]
MSIQTLQVELAERSYPIYIGEGLLQQVAVLFRERGVSERNSLLIITDQHVAPLYLDGLRDRLAQAGYQVKSAVVAAGEQAKSFSVYEQLMTEAISAGLDRKSVILALGGGVIGDLAGFVAATYMRGIPFVQIPTTLLAHDSSVGGKVAINHSLGKNLIGAFHQPLMVIYDTAALHTLPEREKAAGFAEIIKHGLIADEAFVNWLEQNVDPLWTLQAGYIDKAIRQGCAIKANIVSADETEQGQRALLNLGHTFGHAFEALSRYAQLNHGEAIAIGMTLAAKLAERLGLAEAGIAVRTKKLLASYRLPTEWPTGFAPEQVLAAMKRDKKVVQGQLNLVLPRAIGQVEVVKAVDEQSVLQLMRDVQGGKDR